MDNFIIRKRWLMNKFSKTSYPRQHNHNTFLNSRHQRRDKNLPTHDKDPQLGKAKQDPAQQPLHHLLQKKIDIESKFLFNGKPQSSGGKNACHLERSTKQGSRQFCSTSNDGFYKQNDERPQSKNYSRSKMNINTTLNQKIDGFGERPQTSKGRRNVIYTREARKKSLADEQEDGTVEIKRTSKTSTGSRRKDKPQQPQMQTSIDPQFLALFAS